MDKLKESKFVADSAKFISAKAYLDAHFISSSSFSEGLVNTIYFDSLNLSSYDDKVDGQYLKYKFRLRFYEGQSDVFLEKKSKVGCIRQKNRQKVKVNPKELWLDESYCSQFFQFFNQMTDVDSIETYRDLFGLVPVLWVSYYRYRYVCPESRVSLNLDKDICAKGHPSCSLVPDSKIKIEKVVLEIKEKKETLLLRKHPFLREIGFEYQNFSKYGSILSKLLQGVPS